MGRSASKKLLGHLPTDEEKAAIIASLRQMDGAVLALMSASYLNHVLEITIRLHFSGRLTQDEDDRMFNGAQNGILGTFSNKIRMAYALGLLPSEAYKDLLLINDIRNAFAHSLHSHVDFDNNLIGDDCAKLEYLKKYSMDPVPDDPVQLFVETVRKIYLGFREDADNQIAFVTAFEKASAKAFAPFHAPSRGKSPRPSRRSPPT
jgi:hypothetical protein